MVQGIYHCQYCYARRLYFGMFCRRWLLTTPSGVCSWGLSWLPASYPPPAHLRPAYAELGFFLIRFDFRSACPYHVHAEDIRQCVLVSTLFAQVHYGWKVFNFRKRCFVLALFRRAGRPDIRPCLTGWDEPILVSLSRSLLDSSSSSVFNCQYDMSSDWMVWLTAFLIFLDSLAPFPVCHGQFRSSWRHLPREHLPREHLPREHLPREHLPWEHLPREHLPREHLPREHLLREHLPREHLPREHLPREHLPREHLPREHLTREPSPMARLQREPYRE